MDDTRNGRWLTYSELATIRGINRASAVKLVQRERWPRSSGNDRQRTVRVLVPEDWLAPAKESPPDTANSLGMSGEYTGILAALTFRAERAEERADEANKRADIAIILADRTLAQLAEASTRANEAEKALIGERHRADQAETELEAARIAQAEAEADAADLRSSVTRAELAAGVSQERLTQVEAEASELRRRLEAAESAVGSAEHNMASAALVAEELAKQAAERKEQGRWARLRAAWRGE
jgi:hypothetical protein